MKNNLKADWMALVKNQLIEPLSKQLKTYESKAKDVVKEFDLRSRDARDKSKARLDALAAQVKETRQKFEGDIRKLVDRESSRLQKRLTQLFETLKTAAKLEARAEQHGECCCASGTQSSGTSSSSQKKKSGTRKKRKTTKAKA